MRSRSSGESTRSPLSVVIDELGFDLRQLRFEEHALLIERREPHLATGSGPAPCDRASERFSVLQLRHRVGVLQLEIRELLLGDGNLLVEALGLFDEERVGVAGETLALRAGSPLRYSDISSLATFTAVLRRRGCRMTRRTRSCACRGRAAARIDHVARGPS